MTENEQKSREFPVQENMKWQKIEWRIENVGAVLLFLFVIAGACGLFSKGFLSNQQASAADGRLTVEYEHFGRRQSNMDMALRLRQLSGERYRVTISGEAMDNFQVQTLQPQPDETWSSENQLILIWHRRPQQDNAAVWISFQPQSFGHFPITVTLDGRSKVQFSQFIYP